MQLMVSVGKTVTDGKRGKPMQSAGKHVAGGKVKGATSRLCILKHLG